MDVIKVSKWLEDSWKNGANIVVTSDIHGFHQNLAKGSSNWGRDAKTDAERQAALAGCRDFPNHQTMTAKVTENINTVCGVDDILLHLGDWSFGKKENVGTVRDMIQCKNIVNLYGNHDHHLRENPDYQDMFVACLDYLSFRANGNLICCFHFPIDEWDEINRGAFHFFGHRHTIGQKFINGRSMDVGLDSNNCHPYKLEDLVNLFSAQPLVRKHH